MTRKTRRAFQGTPPSTNAEETLRPFVWKDVLGEDKSEQTIAEMRADFRLTDQDRLIVCSWRLPA
jgi:hypothetical protein